MAGVITTGNLPKLLWPGLNSIFGEKYDEHSMECNDLFEVRASNKNYEEVQQVVNFGLAPVKPETASVSYDTQVQGYTARFTNVVYGLGFIVTYEEIEDNLYQEVAERRTRGLAFSMRQTKENVCAQVYNRAFNSSFTGGDGVSLVNAAHPTVGGGTQSNILAVAADLSEAAVEDMTIQIMNALDDRGLRISLMPVSLHVATDNYYEAARILKSAYRTRTADNDINVVYTDGVIPQGAKVNHYFTDADAWWIRTNCPDSMIRFERRALEFSDDNDFDTDNLKYKATERYIPYWADWRGLYGTPGA